MTGLGRAGFYRWRVPRQATPVEMELRDQMQKVALESPAYGYRRIAAELQQRGFEVNHKRVLRMMREDNLLCVRRRAFVVTTDSRHNLPVYPNLAREITPTAVNQLWIADITYIRLRTEFVYLAVVLDAFSRRVIGWALGRTMEAELRLRRYAWR
jgi:putative transposase